MPDADKINARIADIQHSLMPQHPAGIVRKQSDYIASGDLALMQVRQQNIMMRKNRAQFKLLMEENQALRDLAAELFRENRRLQELSGNHNEPAEQPEADHGKGKARNRKAVQGADG